MVVSIRVASVDETRLAAAALAPLMRGGDVLLLSGDLGGGKTAFVQGLAAALGVTGRVTSPTFVLAQTYEGRLRLHHLDVYRLVNPAEYIDLNLPELLEDGAVTAIEWGERVRPELPSDYLLIRFRLGEAAESADVRVLEFEPVGPSWESRAEALGAKFAGSSIGGAR